MRHSTTDVCIDFTEEGNASDFPRFGWHLPEQNHTWTSGTESCIMFPRPSAPGTYLLTLDVRPFILRDTITNQNLTIFVNGTETGSYVLQDQMTIECLVPWRLIRQGREWATITFRHPNAAKPDEVGDTPDQRQIAIAFSRLSFWLSADPPDIAIPNGQLSDGGLESLNLTADLLLAFENLGNSNEFGMVQRHYGIEQPGLLRFASAPLPALITALQKRFEGLGDPDRVEVVLDKRREEYVVFDRSFGFTYRSGLRADANVQAAVIHRQQAAQLSYLRKSLVEDLELSRKIFIYRGSRRLPKPFIDRLLSELRAYGVNTLLWVGLFDKEHPAGSVESLDEGLLKGYLDRFASNQKSDTPSWDCWRALCENAYRLSAN